MTNSNEGKQKSTFMIELIATIRSIIIFIGTLIGCTIGHLFFYYIEHVGFSPNHYFISVIVLIFWMAIIVATAFGMFKLFKRKTIIEVFVCSLVLAAMIQYMVTSVVLWLT
jgi:hypothetical protein